VVPELGAGFDRIECARQARQLAPDGTPPAILPLAAIAEPVAAYAGAGPPLGIDGERRPAFGVAALGLLAAATAASVFLWLRVLGADPSSFSFPGSLAPSAVERRAVAAEIVAAFGGGQAPAATRPAAAAATASAGAAGSDLLAAPVSASAPAAPVAGPLRIPTVSTRRSLDETPTRSDPRTRKARAAGHGAGKAPAHAGNRARPGHAQGQGHENGHGHGRGKKLGHSKHG
jgi:hypothetical protein